MTTEEIEEIKRILKENQISIDEHLINKTVNDAVEIYNNTFANIRESILLAISY